MKPKPNLLTQKIPFNPVYEVIKHERVLPKNLNAILNTIFYYNLVMDNFYVLESTKKNTFYKFKLKKNIQDLNSYTIGTIGRDSVIMESQDTNYADLTEETESIMKEEEILTRNIALLRYPNKDILNDLAKKYNVKPKFVSSISEKVLKNNKEEQKALTFDQAQALRLMDYAVNLVFMREFSMQIKYHSYDLDKLKVLINNVISEIETVLKVKAKQFFKNGEEQNLIERYTQIAIFLKETDIRQRTIISQLIDVWNMDSKAIEGTLKK